MITYYDDFYYTILLLLVNERKVTGSDVRFVQLLGNVLDSALYEKTHPNQQIPKLSLTALNVTSQALQAIISSHYAKLRRQFELRTPSCLCH